MMPRSHRRRSSKESRTRDDHSSDVAAVLDSDVLSMTSHGSSTAATFPTSDQDPAYGDPSCHSDSTTIGR